MPWESIGSVDTGEMPDDEEWILWCLQIARQYVLNVCGEAPEGCTVDVMWHEHELGDYPSLGVSSEDEEPWEYIARCERALAVLNDAVSWIDLKKHLEEADDSEELQDD